MILHQLSSPTLGQFNRHTTKLNSHHPSKALPTPPPPPPPGLFLFVVVFVVLLLFSEGGGGGGGGGGAGEGGAWLVTVVVGMRRDSSFNRPKELVKFSFAWFPFFCIATKCLIPHRPYHYTTKATKHTNRKGKNTERKKREEKTKHNRKQNQILILRKTHQVVCL